jgi:perosamine synthetase
MNWKTPLFKVNIAQGLSVDHLLHSGFIGQGKFVNEFEEKFALKFDIPYDKIVSLNSCTSAIGLALKLIGVKKGDEVATTPYTSIATNVSLGDATLVWYDVDETTGLATLENIKKVIGDKTKVLILVHLFGTKTKDLSLILDYCQQRRIRVIEDAAQALGSVVNNQYISQNSDYVAFSFQAIKHLTTIDGGMLFCRDYQDVQKGRLLRWFGFDRTKDFDSRCLGQDVQELGTKIHMTDVNAYIGIKSLETIDEIIYIHKRNAAMYEKALRNMSTCKPCHLIESGSSFWIYPILIEHDRDGFIEYLKKEGVQASVVHPRLDKLSCFKESLVPLPNMDALMERIVCIPCGWWLQNEDTEYVISLIKNWEAHHAIESV